MKSIIRYAYKGIDWVLDILFPDTCLGCKIKGSIICGRCSVLVRRAERETSGSIYAAYDYRDPLIKKAIWSLKYHTHRHTGQRLGELLYDAFIEEVADMRILAKGQPILVIPIPLSPHRKKSRGYNQAEVIARSFCASTDSNSFKLDTKSIVKWKDTPPQAKITNRTTRLRNIHDAFAMLQPDHIKGRTIIVIDDVTTTGGTITEILKLVRKAGAKKAVGFAVAH